jgi:hypothetical protein
MAAKNQKNFNFNWLEIGQQRPLEILAWKVKKTDRIFTKSCEIFPRA